MILNDDPPIGAQQGQRRDPVLKIPNPAAMRQERFGPIAKAKREKPISIYVKKQGPLPFQRLVKTGSGLGQLPSGQALSHSLGCSVYAI